MHLHQRHLPLPPPRAAPPRDTVRRSKRTRTRTRTRTSGTIVCRRASGACAVLLYIPLDWSQSGRRESLAAGSRPPCNSWPAVPSMRAEQCLETPPLRFSPPLPRTATLCLARRKPQCATESVRQKRPLSTSGRMGRGGGESSIRLT